MKTKLTSITSAALLLFTIITAVAQDAPADVKTRVIAFEQGVAGASNITLAIYPSYAPNLVNADGKKDQFGFGVSATYTFSGALGQHLFTGLRLDYLQGTFWVPSVNGGVKADVQILGHNFVPFAYTGIIKPLTTGNDSATDFGMIAGAGVMTEIWHGKLLGKPAAFSLGVAAEKWGHFDGLVYHIAPALTIKW